MKKPVFYLVIIVSTLLIGFLIFAKNDQKPLDEQEMKRLSKSFGDKFSEMRNAQQNAQSKDSNKNKPIEVTESNNTQSIIGLIYKKPESTWFIKAKDSQQRIADITDRFKQYFLSDLEFDDAHQPIFNHLPNDSKISSSSSMRYATFMIDGVEVSVINLPGQQDVLSNVKRWMGQIGLKNSSTISMDFSNNKKTILVKMPTKSG